MPPKNPNINPNRRMMSKDTTKEDFLKARENEMNQTRRSKRQAGVNYNRKFNPMSIDGGQIDMTPIKRFDQIAAVKKNKLKQIDQNKDLTDAQRNQLKEEINQEEAAEIKKAEQLSNDLKEDIRKIEQDDEQVQQPKEVEVDQNQQDQQQEEVKEEQKEQPMDENAEDKQPDQIPEDYDNTLVKAVIKPENDFETVAKESLQEGTAVPEQPRQEKLIQRNYDHTGSTLKPVLRSDPVTTQLQQDKVEQVSKPSLIQTEVLNNKGKAYVKIAPKSKAAMPAINPFLSNPEEALKAEAVDVDIEAPSAKDQYKFAKTKLDLCFESNNPLSIRAALETNLAERKPKAYSIKITDFQNIKNTDIVSQRIAQLNKMKIIKARDEEQHVFPQLPFPNSRVVSSFLTEAKDETTQPSIKQFFIKSILGENTEEDDLKFAQLLKQNDLAGKYHKDYLLTSGSVSKSGFDQQEQSDTAYAKLKAEQKSGTLQHVYKPLFKQFNARLSNLDHINKIAEIAPEFKDAHIALFTTAYNKMLDGDKPFTQGEANELWQDVVALHSVTSQGYSYPTLLAQGPVKSGKNPQLSMFKMTEEEVRKCVDSLSDQQHKEKVQTVLPEQFLSVLKTAEPSWGQVVQTAVDKLKPYGLIGANDLGDESTLDDDVFNLFVNDETIMDTLFSKLEKLKETNKDYSSVGLNFKNPKLPAKEMFISFLQELSHDQDVPFTQQQDSIGKYTQMLASRSDILSPETIKKLDAFHKAKGAMLVPGLVSDTKFGQEIEGTILNQLLSDKLDARMLAGPIMFNEWFKDVDKLTDQEAEDKYLDYVTFQVQNPLSLAYISNLFGVTPEQYQKLLEEEPVKYRDIPFANFIHEDVDGRRKNLAPQKVEAKDYLFNRNRSLAEEFKYIIEQNENESDGEDNDEFMYDDKGDINDAKQFKYIGNIKTKRLQKESIHLVDQIQKALDDNIMFKVVDFIESGPLRYLAADAAVTNNFNAFLPMHEKPYMNKSKQLNLNILSKAIQKVRDNMSDIGVQQSIEDYKKFKDTILNADASYIEDQFFTPDSVYEQAYSSITQNSAIGPFLADHVIKYGNTLKKEIPLAEQRQTAAAKLFAATTSISPVLDDPITLTRNLIGLDAGTKFLKEDNSSTFGKLVLDSMSQMDLHQRAKSKKQVNQLFLSRHSLIGQIQKRAEAAPVFFKPPDRYDGAASQFVEQPSSSTLNRFVENIHVTHGLDYIPTKKLAEQNYAFRLYPFFGDFPLSAMNLELKKREHQEAIYEQRVPTPQADDKSNFLDVAVILHRRRRDMGAYGELKEYHRIFKQAQRQEVPFGDFITQVFSFVTRPGDKRYREPTQQQPMQQQPMQQQPMQQQPMQQQPMQQEPMQQEPMQQEPGAKEEVKKELQPHQINVVKSKTGFINEIDADRRKTLDQLINPQRDKLPELLKEYKRTTEVKKLIKIVQKEGDVGLLETIADRSAATNFQRKVENRNEKLQEQLEVIMNKYAHTLVNDDKTSNTSIAVTEAIQKSQDFLKPFISRGLIAKQNAESKGESREDNVLMHVAYVMGDKDVNKVIDSVRQAPSQQRPQLWKTMLELLAKDVSGMESSNTPEQLIDKLQLIAKNALPKLQTLPATVDQMFKDQRDKIKKNNEETFVKQKAEFVQVDEKIKKAEEQLKADEKQMQISDDERSPEQDVAPVQKKHKKAKAEPFVQFQQTDPSSGVKYTASIGKASPFQGAFSMRRLHQQQFELLQKQNSPDLEQLTDKGGNIAVRDFKPGRIQNNPYQSSIFPDQITVNDKLTLINDKQTGLKLNKVPREATYYDQIPEGTQQLQVNIDPKHYHKDSVEYDQGMKFYLDQLEAYNSKKNLTLEQQTANMNVVHNLLNLKIGNDIYNEPNPFHSAPHKERQRKQVETIQSYLHDVHTGLADIQRTDLFATFGSQQHIKQVSDNYRQQYGPPLTESDFEMNADKAFEILKDSIDIEKNMVEQLSQQVHKRLQQSFDDERPFNVRELIPHFSIIKEQESKAQKDQPTSTAKQLKTFLYEFDRNQAASFVFQDRQALLSQNNFDDFNKKSEQDKQVIKQMREGGYSEQEIKVVLQARNSGSASRAKDHHIAKQIVGSREDGEDMLESAEVVKVASEYIQKHLTSEYDAELQAVQQEILSYTQNKKQPSEQQAKRDAANLALARQKLSHIHEKTKYVGRLSKGLGNLSDIIVAGPSQLAQINQQQKEVLNAYRQLHNEYRQQEIEKFGQETQTSENFRKLVDAMHTGQANLIASTQRAFTKVQLSMEENARTNMTEITKTSALFAKQEKEHREQSRSQNQSHMEETAKIAKNQINQVTQLTSAMDTVIENQAKAIKRNQDEEEKRLKNAYKDFDDYKARVESVLKQKQELDQRELNLEDAQDRKLDKAVLRQQQTIENLDKFVGFLQHHKDNITDEALKQSAQAAGFENVQLDALKLFRQSALDKVADMKQDKLDKDAKAVEQRKLAKEDLLQKRAFAEEDRKIEQDTYKEQKKRQSKADARDEYLRRVHVKEVQFEAIAQAQIKEKMTELEQEQLDMRILKDKEQKQQDLFYAQSKRNEDLAQKKQDLEYYDAKRSQEYNADFRKMKLDLEFLDEKKSKDFAIFQQQRAHEVALITEKAQAEVNAANSIAQANKTNADAKRATDKSNHDLWKVIAQDKYDAEIKMNQEQERSKKAKSDIDIKMLDGQFRIDTQKGTIQAANDAAKLAYLNQQEIHSQNKHARDLVEETQINKAIRDAKQKLVDTEKDIAQLKKDATEKEAEAALKNAEANLVKYNTQKEKQAFENSKENKERREADLELKKAETKLRIAETNKTEQETLLKTMELQQKRQQMDDARDGNYERTEWYQKQRAFNAANERNMESAMNFIRNTDAGRNMTPEQLFANASLFISGKQSQSGLGMKQLADGIVSSHVGLPGSGFTGPASGMNQGSYISGAYRKVDLDKHHNANTRERHLQASLMQRGIGSNFAPVSQTSMKTVEYMMSRGRHQQFRPSTGVPQGIVQAIRLASKDKAVASNAKSFGSAMQEYVHRSYISTYNKMQSKKQPRLRVLNQFQLQASRDYHAQQKTKSYHPRLSKIDEEDEDT